MGQGIAELAGSFGVSVHAIVRKKLPHDFEAFLNRRTQRLFLKNEYLKSSVKNMDFNPIKIYENLSALNEYKPDLIIECIDEKIKDKIELLSDVKSKVSGNYVLATNTSSFSINEINERAKIGPDFIGIHFMNPPRMVSLVEVILGESTSQRARDVAKSFLDFTGKTSVEIKDYPAFVVNRLLIPMINEASRMLEKKVCEIKDIDQIMQLGAGHPLGPLALADLIGIDICVEILRSIYINTQNEFYKPSELMVKMVREGACGRKSKLGFYQY